MRGSAVISDCELFRYRVDRYLSDAPLVFAYFGVNPSTADGVSEDQTTHKWNHFTQTYGGGRWIAGNPMALRSTDVKGLVSAPDPVGPENFAYLAQIISEADILVPCWGNRSKVPPRLHCHIDALKEMIMTSGKTVAIFGLTKSGDPKHPLMLGHNTPLVEWSV